MLSNLKPKRAKLIQTEKRLTAEQVVRITSDLIHAFINHPKSLKISSGKIGNSVAISIGGHADDHPKLVGKQGKRHLALQTLITQFGRRCGYEMIFDLRDPVEGVRQEPGAHKNNSAWEEEKTFDLFKRCLKCALTLPFTLVFVPVGDGIIGIELGVNELELPSVRGDLFRSLTNIFTAIGWRSGRNIIMKLNDPNPLPAAPAINADLPIVRKEPPIDAIEAEARGRGLA